MTNKSLLVLFLSAALFCLGYFYILPKTEIKKSPTNAMQIAAPPAPIIPLDDASAVKLPNSSALVTAPAGSSMTANPAALKTFDQFTPIERDRLRLEFEAMSEPERLFAVISAEDEAWKKDNFFPE